MKNYGAITAKKIFTLLAVLFPVTAFAQSIFIYPATVTAPQGSYQTVTAVVNGVNNKTVTWSATGGTLVGTNPCVVNEPCTIALYATTPGTYTLTAASNANSSVVATSTVTVTASPVPVTTHPRFLIAPTNLTALQAKATPGNTIYQGIRTQAIAYYNSDNAVWSWSCNSGTGQPSVDRTGYYEEITAFYYSYMAMIDPSDPTYHWACYAHDVAMYYMPRYVANGVAANEWSDSSSEMALTPDWLLGSGAVTSSSDMATLRSFLAYMARLVMTYGSAQNPAGTYNSSSMFSTGSTWDLGGMRSLGGNNYNISRILYLTAAGLTFNDNTTDDPPLANTCGATRYQVCPDFTAGSLHAYWKYLDGAVLYDYWAHIEDPNVSWKAYQNTYGNLPTQPTCEGTDLAQHPCFGDGRGGESSEGSWYQYSMYRARYALNMIYTSGMNDPILYGPQISAVTSSWWDLKYVSDLEFLTGPTQRTSVTAPAYNFLTTGDSNAYYRNPNDMWTEAAMLTFDSYTGRTDRTNALKWINFNMAFGGPLGTSWGCASYCGYDYQLGNNNFSGLSAFDMFIALPAADPVAGALPSDPRPSLPLDLYNGSLNQHGMVRDSWNSGSNTLFSYYFPNALQNHEYQFAGRFDIFANGEYITKGRTVFNDYNLSMTQASFQNLMSIFNSTGSGCTAYPCTNWQVFSTGGQMTQSSQAGLNSLNHSELPAYVATVADLTNDYNGAAAAGSYIYPTYNDVLGASRSLIYLRGTNQVVLYDRATVGHAASTQTLSQITTGPITVSGQVASWPTRSGKQKAYFTSLLPSGASVADGGLPCPGCSSDQTEDWEPYSTVSVSPAGTPTSTQFLSVMEWGTSGLSRSATTLVQSTAGQNFDCAEISSSMVCFMRNWPAAFSNVTYPASGATTQYISDLTPNTTYTISGAGTPASATSDNAGVLTFSAAGTGSITVGGGSSSPSLQSITVTPTTTTLQALGTQQYVATCNNSDGSTTNCTSSVTWASSSMAVVTVNSSGMATGVAQGSANIVATSGSIQGQASVTVPAATLQAISVTPGSMTVMLGNTQQMKATGTYSDSSTTDVTSMVSWSSSNPSVVAPSPTGLVSTMSQGSATITAASGSVAGNASVTVSTVSRPTITPEAGTYSSAQTVTISTTTQSATIYYTTDGSTPTTSSTVYTGPITVAATETVEAIAAIPGGTPSGVRTATYTITQSTATPAFSPAGGTYSSAQTVTISTTTPSATIYYTTNGSTPTTSSPVYTGPITVAATETLEAIAVATGGSASPVGSAAYTITTQTATPAFSPAGGTYTSTQTVTISTTTPSATIHYTTNGSTPTANSQVYSGPITVAATETVNAIAMATGNSASPMGSAVYTITPPAAAPAFSPAGGTYASTQTVTISTTTPSATIYYTTNGATPTANSQVYSGPITVAATETVSAIAIATGDSASPASSAVYTITLPTAAPAFNPAGGTYTSAQTVSISTTTPSATIYYTTNGATPTTSSPVYTGPITVAATETLRAIAVATGNSASPVSSAAYTITLPTATPVFSPAGGTYKTAQTITISTSTPSATIYYTTNGATPTTGSAVYTGPITVAATETLQAIAVATGDSASPVNSAVYTITTQTAMPAISPAGGTYTSAQTVSISSSTPSATIYYTTNGAKPTTSSAVYTGPITVAATETVKAMAVAAGGSASQVNSAAFTITLPAATPTFSPAGGTYKVAQTVSIKTSTRSATIYYTTNGSTPTTSSTVYAGQVTVAATETLQAIAIAAGDSASLVGSAAYTITPVTAVPTFSPAGGTYNATQTVTISSTTPSAIIHYTTNGSAPTTNSKEYTGPIKVAATETVSAIAIAAGDSASPGSSAAYTIAPTATPTFSPAGGTYGSAQSVTISTTASSATIYYTTNGSTPTTSSPIYSGPITVSASETVNAIAVYTDGSNAKSQNNKAAVYSTSAVGTATYAFGGPTPMFSVAVMPTALTVPAGQSGTATVLIAPQNGFASPVSLSCSGLPAGASCKFSPAPVTPSGTVASVTMTVTTSGTGTPANNSSPAAPASAAALLFCCFGWKRRRSMQMLVLAVAATVGLGLCTGCGVANVITPIGSTSTVAVIATDGNLQPSTSFTLMVQ